jgi:hypothetical protein
MRRSKAAHGVGALLAIRGRRYKDDQSKNVINLVDLLCQKRHTNSFTNSYKLLHLHCSPA